MLSLGLVMNWIDSELFHLEDAELCLLLAMKLKLNLILILRELLLFSRNLMLDCRIIHARAQQLGKQSQTLRKWTQIAQTKRLLTMIYAHCPMANKDILNMSPLVRYAEEIVLEVEVS